MRYASSELRGDDAEVLEDTFSDRPRAALDTLAFQHAVDQRPIEVEERERLERVGQRLLERDGGSGLRGLVLDSHPTLLDGTLEDNITLGRPTIDYQDLQWALRFVELDHEIDALPQGLNTRVSSLETNLSMSQILRLLVARAIVIRPQLLIFDGTLHNMLPATREVLLRRLCAKDEPWSVIFLSNDPNFSAFVDRRISLDS